MSDTPQYTQLRRLLATAQAERDEAVARARRLQTAGDEMAAAADLFGNAHTARWGDHFALLHRSITAWRAL